MKSVKVCACVCITIIIHEFEMGIRARMWKEMKREEAHIINIEYIQI